MVSNKQSDIFAQVLSETELYIITKMTVKELSNKLFTMQFTARRAVLIYDNLYSNHATTNYMVLD